MARAAKKDVPLLAPEEYAARSRLEVVICRAGQHDWPIIRPGKPMPPGILVYKHPDGFVQVVYTCSLCGRIKDEMLLPGAVLGESMDRRYKKPRDKGWIVVPRKAGMSKIDWQRAYYGQISDVLLAAAIPLPADED